MFTGMDKVAANTPENPAPANSYSPGESENGMTLFEHLGELRKRLLIILAGLAVGVIVSFAFADRLIQFMAQPIGGLANLQSIEITENVGVFMRVSLLGGFILAFPLILYEIIAFVVPGLKSSERKWVFLSIPLLFLMFVGGVAFTYLVMLPAAVPFLVSFLGVTTVPRLSNYFNFVTNLMFWVGIIFETPLVFFILAKLHIVTAGMLLKGWRFAVIISAGVAALITPTVDPVNMALFMTPMLGLYLLSVLMAVFAR
jgi:sec-independent protein translocase protein TatC